MILITVFMSFVFVVMGLTGIGAGLFCLLGGIFAWDWFMNDEKARFLAAMLSRTGARVFYGLARLSAVFLGIYLIILAVKVWEM